MSHADENGWCRCITCGKQYRHNDAQMQAGHLFHGRNATYFLPTNCHPQCRNCNFHCDGKPRTYSLYVAETYGVAVLRWLYDLSNTYVEFTRADLELIVEESRANIRANGVKPCR